MFRSEDAGLHIIGKGGIYEIHVNAYDGDVKYLLKVYEDHGRELMTSLLAGSRDEESMVGNLIHIAVKANHYVFLSDALEMLPSNGVIELVCETDKAEGSNPLHYAAKEGNIFTAKLLVNAYVSAADILGTQGIPPWLRTNSEGDTPVHCCFTKKAEEKHECVARYLVSTEHRIFKSSGDEEKNQPPSKRQSTTTTLDRTGASVLFYAVREGFSLLVKQILTSDLPYSHNGTCGENPLHHASKCQEEVSRLLLKAHPEFIVEVHGCNDTVLDRAVEHNAAWLVKLMLTEDEGSIDKPPPWIKACRRLIWHINPGSFGDTPLHIAARKGYIDIAKLIIKGSKSAIRDEAKVWDTAKAHSTMDRLGVTPLHIENLQKDLPLFVALKHKHDEFGVYILSIETIFNITELKDREGKNAYEIAVENNCEQSRKKILERTVRHNVEDLLNSEADVKIMHPSMLKIFRHIASTYSARNEMLTSENIAKLVVEGLPKFKREPDKDAISHLREAAERGDDWLVKLLLKGDSSLIDYSAPAWQIACEKGHFSTLLAFIEQCGHQGFTKLCHHNQQTPLHHINLPSYEQYMKLLENPVMQELRNQLDVGGATPLHRALECNNISLAKALLKTKDVRFDIQDRDKKTAIDILEEKSTADVRIFKLYKELLANPLMTPELKNRIDKEEATSLHRAIKRNALELTKALLETEGIKIDIADKNHKTALDLLEDKCIGNDKFFELYKELLAKPLMTQELKNRVDDNGDTSLHRAILQNVRRLVKALVETKGVKLDAEDKNSKTAVDLIEERCSIKSDDVFWYELYKKLLANPDRFQKMKNQLGSSGGTPLHLAIEWDDLTLAKKLVWSQGIKLNIEDKNGKTALDLIEARCSQPDSFWYNIYEELLASKLVTYEMKNRVDINGDTSLHKAIVQNANKLVKTLINTKEVEYEVKNKNNRTAVDMIEERCKDKTIDGFWFEQYKKLLANSDILQKRKNHKGGSGFTPLHIAIEWEDLKLAKTLVHTKGIELSIENPHRKTALQLIEERSERTDSPLYELYKELWDIPNFIHELKNRQVQYTKETPLHRAIRWDDINLAKTLLETKGLELDIRDENGKTALDLLDKRYKSGEDKYRKWVEMCREIRLDPSLKIFGYKYLLRRTSFTDMRATLSVVAALLATISFAAGFTVPGGVDSKYGTATLATEAVFLVFAISNTLAMCSSIVVLFMVIGAMYWEAHPRATPLIDLSMGLLKISLLCTIAAFMTGVYTIMAPKVMWAAVLVIGLCSVAFFVALCVVATFWPLLYKPLSCIFGICCCNRANTDDCARAVPPQNHDQQLDTVIVQTAQCLEP